MSLIFMLDFVSVPVEYYYPTLFNSSVTFNDYFSFVGYHESAL